MNEFIQTLLFLLVVVFLYEIARILSGILDEMHEMRLDSSGAYFRKLPDDDDDVYDKFDELAERK